MANCFLPDWDFGSGKSAAMLNLSQFPIARPVRPESVVPSVLRNMSAVDAEATEVNLSAKCPDRLVDVSRAG